MRISVVVPSFAENCFELVISHGVKYIFKVDETDQNGFCAFLNVYKSMPKTDLVLF